MIDQMLQLSLLAQDDASEWINILFMVVLAVFWAIGGLLKSGANKKGKQGARKPQSASPDAPKRKSWLEQLAKKAEEIQRAIESENAPPEQRPAKPGTAKPAKSAQPPGGRVAVRTGRDGRSVLVYERESQAVAAPATQAPVPAAEQPERVKQAAPPKSMSERLAELERAQEHEDLGVTSVAETAPQEPKPLVIDYTEPDALKKAILSYEILGKPMALRDPFERGSFT